MRMTLLSLLHAAQFAQLSYEDPEIVSLAYRGGSQCPQNTLQCMQRVVQEPVYLSDPRTDVQAYVMVLDSAEVDRSTLLVTVRGTSSLIDAFHDIVATSTAMPAAAALASGVRVHAGFLAQYNALAPLLRPLVVQQQKLGVFDIVFTGHSAGAAIGALAALHTALDNEQHVEFIGFGSPHVGNAAFCTLFREHIEQPVLIKHSRDPITSALHGLGYARICEQQCYGKFDLCPSIPFLFFLPEHDIAKYVTAIAKNETVRDPTVLDKAIQTVASWIFDRLK